MNLGDLEEMWEADPASVPFPEPIEIEEDERVTSEPEPAEKELVPVPVKREQLEEADV